MKKILLALVIINTLTACSQRPKAEKEEIEEIAMIMDENSFYLSEHITQLAHYFATFKPIGVTTLVLDKNGFKEHFNVARTMNSDPTIVDFEKEGVFAIVAPETNKETIIELGELKIKDKHLVVHYSIKPIGAERTFTIAPSLVYVYDLEYINIIDFVQDNK